MSRVAVVTRTRDRAFLLERALRSCAQQQFSDVEHIVVNDGGDPDPVEHAVGALTKSWQQRVKIVHRAASEGMEAASRAGIEASDSEFIVIHDDDDSWQPDFLLRTVGYLDASSNAAERGVITHSNRIVERVDQQAIHTVTLEPFNAQMGTVSLAEMLAGNRFPPISFLFQRQAHDDVGGFDPTFPVLGDWDFNIRFLRRWDVGVVAEPLANWHHRAITNSSLDNSTADNAHELQRVAIDNARVRAALDSDESVATAVLGLVGESMERQEQRLEKLQRDMAVLQAESQTRRRPPLAAAASRLIGETRDHLSLLRRSRYGNIADEL
ncbi:MAG: glycosyltransferase involved in cell wall biosynthesis [Candidatus Poriferisodalaceae bacterium]|jgi:glycosyltransferase involved in cell wall biosynthesis